MGADDREVREVFLKACAAAAAAARPLTVLYVVYVCYVNAPSNGRLATVSVFRCLAESHKGAGRSISRPVSEASSQHQ